VLAGAVVDDDVVTDATAVPWELNRVERIGFNVSN
jgi:hypothetical protein